MKGPTVSLAGDVSDLSAATRTAPLLSLARGPVLARGAGVEGGAVSDGGPDRSEARTCRVVDLTGGLTKSVSLPERR